MIEAPDTERQLDEFGEPIPTEEELAKQRADQEAERLNTEQALKLAGGMTGIESQLPNRLPTQPATASSPAPQLQGPNPVSAPVMPPPQSSGVPVQDSARLPLIDGNITPMPQARRTSDSTVYPVYRGVSPPQESRNKYPVKQMLNMGMKPRDIMAVVEAARRYDSERSYQADIAKGMPQAAALAKWGPMLFSGSRGMAPSEGRPMTEYQRSIADHRKFLETQNAANQKSMAEHRKAIEAHNAAQWSVADNSENKALLDQETKLQAEFIKIGTTKFDNPNQKLEAEANLSFRRLQLSNQRKALAQKYHKSQPTTATGTTAPPPVQAPAPQGQPVKDKSGKTWIYTGSAADPKTDKDPSHWTAQ